MVKGDVVEKFDVALAEIATKVASLAEKHGSDAINLAGFVLQMDAIQKLISPVFVAAMAVGLVFWMRRTWPKSEWDDPFPANPWAFGVILQCIGIGFSGAFVFFHLERLVSPILWASAFDPHVAIAAKVLGALK
jgi:hypothetical protein